MKVSLVCFLFLLVSFFIAPEKALGQSTSTNALRPTSEQSLQELVREVRQLRATLQRINTAMYKGQVILERFKFQQEQVSRLSRELSQTRESVSEMASQKGRMKELVKSAEAGVELGQQKPAELASLKTELEWIKEREQKLIMRESQLVNELELERAKLNELSDRLTVLESELVPGKP